jgi:hypothetical protein
VSDVARPSRSSFIISLVARNQPPVDSYKTKGRLLDFPRLANNFGRRSRDHKFNGGFFMRSKLLTLFIAVAVVVGLTVECSVAALAYQGNANKSAAPAKPRAKKRKKPASHMAAMPTDPQGCLNRLATLAAREPLPSYDGEPSKIINDGMLWTNGKCAVTDQAQRLKLADLANKWRMNDAAGVRAALQEMGATATSSADMGSPARTPRSRRGRRMPASETPASSDTQATPPPSSDTQVAPQSDETSGTTNSNTRRPRRRSRPRQKNTNTANTNS